MIEIKLATEEEHYLIAKTFKNQELNRDFYMVVKDGEQILGYSSGIFPHKKFALVKDLNILPTERGMGLGDGLLRSTFNTLELKGFKWILIEGRKELKDFLLHEGLVSLEDASLSEELITAIEEGMKNFKKGYYYFCEPKEFFSRKCKGSKR